MIAQNRLRGFGLMAALLVALVLLGRAMAFGNPVVGILYALLFAVGIWLSAPEQSRFARLGWAAGLSIALVVTAAVINSLIAPGQEGGLVLGLIVFGFYLGLPTLIFATLLSFAPKPGVAK